MREIKFRVWDPNDKQFVYWGELLEYIATNKSSKGMQQLLNKAQQFTGLKDKNGVEIYEGDIVKFATSKDHYRGPVGFGKGMYTVKVGLDFYLSEIVERGAEVTGNIYEDKELLK